jgi:hypothetical protein
LTIPDNFRYTSDLCPISVVGKTLILGGNPSDYRNSDASSSVMKSSTNSDPFIVFDLPPIFESEWYFTWRVRAFCQTCSIIHHTETIRVKLSDCTLAQITAPAILPNTPGMPYLEMSTADLIYRLPSQFTVDLSNQCLVGSISIVAASSGTLADTTTSDGLRQVYMLTELEDPTIDISIPDPQENFRDLAFRVKLDLNTGQQGWTSNIFVRVYDCSLAVVSPSSFPTAPVWWPDNIYAIASQFYAPAYCG